MSVVFGCLVFGVYRWTESSMIIVHVDGRLLLSVSQGPPQTSSDDLLS